MVKLYLRIVLFFLPVFVLLTILPINKRLKYQGLKGGCSNRGIWIHDRVFINEIPIDIAFVGTSRTSNGISDKLIQKTLEKDSIYSHVANLGYCRDGRNVSYSFIKDILKGKQIQYLFFEVREDEARKGHDIFPYVAETNDVLAPVLFYNPGYFSDIWYHFAYRLELFQDDIFNRVEPVDTVKGNFRSMFFKRTVSPKLLDKAKERRERKYRKLPIWERNFHMHYPRGYIKKVYNLCEENGVELKFLYIPGYAIPHELPEEIDFYKQYGEVYLPPRIIFDKQTNWVDHEHLNEAGAYELSYWFADEVKRRNLLN